MQAMVRPTRKLVSHTWYLGMVIPIILLAYFL
jgi:hypothetical protein